MVLPDKSSLSKQLRAHFLSHLCAQDQGFRQAASGHHQPFCKSVITDGFIRLPLKQAIFSNSAKAGLCQTTLIDNIFQSDKEEPADLDGLYSLNQEAWAIFHSYSFQLRMTIEPWWRHPAMIYPPLWIYRFCSPEALLPWQKAHSICQPGQRSSRQGETVFKPLRTSDLVSPGTSFVGLCFFGKAKYHSNSCQHHSDASSLFILFIKNIISLITLLCIYRACSIFIFSRPSLRPLI